MKKNVTRLVAALVFVIAAVIAIVVIVQQKKTPASNNTPAPSVSPSADPESTPEIKPINGIISELYENGSFLVRHEDGTDVMVKVSADTVVTHEGELAKGQFVMVDYNGVMTRSLPPQITADRIYGATLEGAVSSIEGRDVRLETESVGQVIVHIPEDMALPILNDQIRVHYDGVMTLSLPGQINALMIESVPDERAR